MNYTELEQKFFGRLEILNLLKRRVIDLQEGYRQNVAILGNQYVGKTTLLHHFISNLDENIVTVYLDLENKDFEYFFYKFTGSILYSFSKCRQLPLHEDLNLLLENTKNFIPQTVDAIKKIHVDFSNKKFTDCFVALLDLPDIFTNETGKSCILILDEFQNLEGFPVPDIFQSLGKKIMTQKRCFYIISSSYQGIAERILSEKLSLLFGNFEVIHLGHFDLETSQKFIESHLKDIKIGTQLRNFLIDFTGGHPLCLNLVCQELISLCAIHKQTEIFIPLISQTIENLIFDRWGILSRHFELIVNDLCSGKGNRTVAQILMSLSNGKHKMNDLIEYVGMKKGLMTQKINRLLEQGIIMRNGNSYYFRDKLFKYWIKYVYQKRIKDVELACDKQQKKFKDELNTAIENFKMYSRQDFSSRIIELLHCFDNEAFDLNGRRYKMPSFREIVSTKLRNDSGHCFDLITANTMDSVWFIVFKKEKFAENDMNTILAETQKTGRKPERCLLISLSQLDDNIRLRALQEKFWIWNEGELNTLLTFFDKPYIL